MSENLSFEGLFAAYRTNYSNSLMTREQNFNLQIWHERWGTAGITLSQADKWMMQAGLIKKKVLSITDTGKTFSKLEYVSYLTFQFVILFKLNSFSNRRFSLDENQFMEYLEMLSQDKTLNLDDMKSKLLSAGSPSIV